MDMLATLAPLLLIVGVFWLLILRPARARQKAQQDLVSSVRPGQRIMTTAGLLGTVTEVTDDEIGLEIAPGIVVRYIKAAVGRVLPDEDESLDHVEGDADDVVDVTDASADLSVVGDKVGEDSATGRAAS